MEPRARGAVRIVSFLRGQARRLAGRDPAKKETDEAQPASCVPGRITGAFAISAGKVTGNSEFLFRPRQNRGAAQPVIRAFLPRSST